MRWLLVIGPYTLAFGLGVLVEWIASMVLLERRYRRAIKEMGVLTVEIVNETEEGAHELGIKNFLRCPFEHAPGVSNRGMLQSQRCPPDEAGERVYVVACMGCGARGPQTRTPEHAIAAWNERAAQSERTGP